MKKVIVLLALSMVFFSCKNGKIKIPPGRGKIRPSASIGKIMTGVVVATGAYLVTEEILKKSFQNSNNAKPIKAEFKNSATKSVPIKITNDGKKWRSKTIAPHEVISFTSSDKGIIGLECDGQYLKIDQSNFFTINNNGGTINFYGH